jgi:cation transport ATPase
MKAVGATLVHETATRMRFRLGPGIDPAHARVAFEFLRGVRSVRCAAAARSVVVLHDGRADTRRAIIDLLPTLAARDAGSELPRRGGVALPLPIALTAAAVTPLLPAAAGSAVALSLVGARTIGAWRRGSDMAAHVLDAVSLAVSALTGHPSTATGSLLMGSAAEHQRNRMLRETDQLLAYLAPPVRGRYEIERAGKPLTVDASALVVGDRVRLGSGAVVPADGIVLAGSAEIGPAERASQPAQRVARADRIASGARVLHGEIQMRVERPAARSRNARLRDHARHVLRTRDAPGTLTPDLERLIALPMTAAGLVLALTGDAARTAAMLQADPQLGIALAQPVAREAAVYAIARHGVLLTGLESLDRLATATTIAFEDVGVLSEPYWSIERVMAGGELIDPQPARRWLARLAGHDDDALIHAGLPDELVAAWREHGAVLHEAGRVLHIGGAALLARTWGLQLTEPDRRSLVRRIGVVEGGRLLMTVHLGCRLRKGVAEQFARLRALGVRRIAVFTEDPSAQPARALLQLGADDVVSEDRRVQERWLDAAVERGERVALVHTGLRELLPPGGLSLCPADAEAGAHGVLLGEPLPSLLAARAGAMAVRRRLRKHFGASVTLNAALMVAAALRWLPPLATAGVKHGLAFLLLRDSARLARFDVGGDFVSEDAQTPEQEPFTV